MGIEIPGWLRGAAKVACGEDWPDGDETAMRRLADSWNEMAVKIGDVSVVGDDASKAALATVEGAVHDAIAEQWQALGHEGLTKLQELADHMQETLEEGAADIEKAKIDILAALSILAAQIVADLAIAAFTFGIGGIAAGAAETAATQITVRMIIRELIQKLLTRAMAKAALKAAALEAVKKAALKVSTDLGTQAAQIATGRRSEFKFDDVLRKDVGAGLAEGFVGGGLGKEGFGEISAEGAGKLTKMGAHAVVNSVSETAAKVSETAAKGDDIDWSTFTSGAIGGAAGGAWEGHKAGGEEVGGEGTNPASDHSGDDGAASQTTASPTHNDATHDTGESGSAASTAATPAPTRPGSSLNL